MKGENNPQRGVRRREKLMHGGSTSAAASTAPSTGAAATETPSSAPGGRLPNILFIMGDDVGVWNISA